MLFKSLSLHPTHEALMVFSVRREWIEDVSNLKGCKLSLRVLDYSVIARWQGILSKLEHKMALEDEILNELNLIFRLDIWVRHLKLLGDSRSHVFFDYRKHSMRLS